MSYTLTIYPVDRIYQIEGNNFSKLMKEARESTSYGDFVEHIDEMSSYALYINYNKGSLCCPIRINALSFRVRKWY